MRLFRAADMNLADERAAEAGVGTSVLMDSAGRAVAASVERHFPEADRVLVLCGKGNNGGDGYVAARYLLDSGRTVTVLELGDVRSGDAGAARAVLLERHPVAKLEPESLGSALERCELAIDALFGSGLSRPLEGDAALVVAQLAQSEVPILAVDLPSGIDADSPVPPGPHVRATRTVQLAGLKVSSAFEPARSAYGEQELADIGIPEHILAELSTVRLLDSAGVRAALPTRAREAHKYEVGTVLVLAGSASYLGAAELACRGAYRAGAGLVTLAAEDRLASSWPEIIFLALSWDDSPLQRLDEIGERRAQAIVAGPGLDPRALEHLPGLLARYPVPWVLDAGALRPTEALRQAVHRHGGCVLTPHAGEAARVLATTSAEVVADPLAAASRIAREWNAVCVLKGVGTVVAGSDSVAVSTEGHEGMATGGTGDVLAGILGAFLAAPGGKEAMVARSEAGVALHGLAGRLAGEQLGIGMLASDLVAKLPLALRLLGAPDGTSGAR